ncbi:MAG TPA: response regulator transcription factor [Bryobacteraceae bacterium]|nr:response regulator transcription factor [Bryobacteraceae bacterium]
MDTNKPPKLLIVEDEPELAMGLRDNFEFEGFTVITAGDGEEGLRKAFAEQPDLILLDIMLPKMSGLDLCKALRARGYTTPIVMLTARCQEKDVVAGLETGADDYVTKPFRLLELVARVRAHLRRSAAQPVDLTEYEFGGLRVDFKNYQAIRSGAPLALSPREFEILRFFILHRGDVVTREQLLEQVWEISSQVMTRTVDNHIAKLRQKIEDEPAEPRWIVTVHRSGYRFLG